jgi:putative flippase GtrA
VVSDRTFVLMMRWKELPPVFRFLLVGGINTMFGYGAYAFFLWSGLHYASAALFATIAGVIFNFFTTGRLVFDRVLRARMAPRYLGVYAAVYAINVASLWALAELHVDPYLAGLLLIIPMAAIAFALMRAFVFGANHVAD